MGVVGMWPVCPQSQFEKVGTYAVDDHWVKLPFALHALVAFSSYYTANATLYRSQLRARTLQIAKATLYQRKFCLDIMMMTMLFEKVFE